MQKKQIGMIGSILAIAISPLCAGAGKLEEWTKFRPLVVTAMACEKWYVNTELARMNADKNPPYGVEYVRQALIKRAAFWQDMDIEHMMPGDKNVVLDDKMCNDKIQEALEKFLSQSPHKTLDDAENAFRSSIGNYLFGRWAVHVSRLGLKDRILTASAKLIQQHFSDMQSDLRYPAREFGTDKDIQAKAEEDPVLKLWISWDVGGEPELNQVQNESSDLAENLHVNGILVQDGTTYQRTLLAMQNNALEKAIVGSVAHSAIQALEDSTLEHGEKVVQVKAGTYSVVFFQPLGFKVDQCTQLVNTGTWTLSGTTLTPEKACAEYVKRNAWITPFPVAVSPALGKLLKPGVSNLNCFLNANYIAVENKNRGKETVLATYNKQKVLATSTVSSSGQNADGSRISSYATVSVLNNVNQPLGGYLEACVPITLWDGYGPTKTLKMFMGISITR